MSGLLKRIEEHYPLNAHRIFKYNVLMSEASRVESGVIVELGTYHGAGAVALAIGTQLTHKVPVYTIDDYSYKTGWAGEAYTNEDERIFKSKMFEYPDLEIRFIKGNISNISLQWSRQIGLLFWDLGCMDRMLADIWAWGRFIIPNGRVIIHDTFDFKLGTEDVLRELSDEFSPIKIADNPQGMTLLVRDCGIEKDKRDSADLEGTWRETKEFLKKTPRIKT